MYIIDELKELKEVIDDAFNIGENSPELNMNNYTDGEASDLNDAMISILTKLEEAKTYL